MIVTNIFEVVDKATKPLQNIASKTDALLGKVTNAASALIGLGSGFAIAATVTSLEQTYRVVGNISAATGLTVDKASNATQVFDDWGLELGESERILIGMTRKSADFADESSAVGKIYRRIGVTMKDGPLDTLEKMAKAAEKGKLSVADLQDIGIRQSQAGEVLAGLKKGPEALKKAFDEAQGAGQHVNNTILQSYYRMFAARDDMLDAWRGLVNITYSHLMPVLTGVFEAVGRAIEGWTPAIQRFAVYLEDHMQKIIEYAGKFVKVMALNKGVSLLSGGTGIGGVAKAVMGGSKGIGDLGGILGPVLKVIMRFPGPFAAIALAVGIVLSHWEKFKPLFMNLWKVVQDLGKSLWVGIEPLLKMAERFAVPALGAAFEVLTWALEKIVVVIKSIIDWVDTLFNFVARIIENPTKIFSSDELWAGIEQEKMIRRQKAAFATVNAAFVEGFSGAQAKQAVALADKLRDTSRRASVYQDFRGSKFDITQTFAEGFDPDRIATVLGSQISALGERQLQSGFAPLYGVR